MFFLHLQSCLYFDGDIEVLKVDDIDFANNYITMTNSKTKKSVGSRPMPTAVMAELRKFVNGSSAKQVKLFNNNFNHRRSKIIYKVAGLSDLKFHDLRKTFDSMLAQNGISAAVTQRLLQHSSPTPTNQVYTNVDPVLRYTVDQLPVESWL